MTTPRSQRIPSLAIPMAASDRIRGRHRRQISVPSARVSASSMSTPRYRTVFSILE